jgi:6-phosphogluconolactonase
MTSHAVGASAEAEPEVVVVADPTALADAAAERIATTLAQVVAARGRADWVTTGGSTAPAIYRRLAEGGLREVVPWSAVHVWWGDDRFVPRDHPLSNVKPLDDILLSIGYTEEGQLGLGKSGATPPVPLPIENLHPFRTTEAIGEARGAAWCATQLAEEVRAAGLDVVDGWPVFDLVVVGVGTDGHALSVFPGSAALGSSDVALAVPAPTHIEPHVERVTLNPAVLSVARQVLALAAGAGKAAMLRDVFGPTRDANRWPAQLARREGATWYVDTAAAAGMPR